MAMRVRHLSLVPVVFLAVMAGGCVSGFYKHVPVYKSDQTYLYTLAETAYPDESAMRAQLKAVQPLPENAATSLLNLFSHLKYEDKGLFGTTQDYIFAPDQLKGLAPALKDVLKTNPPGGRILLVTQFDRFHSVLSKKSRTTVLFWSDGEFFHVVFGEINADIVTNDYTQPDSWLEIYPVNMKNASSGLKILEDPIFEYGKMGDRTHLTWVVMPVAKFTALKADPDFFTQGKDKRPIEPKATVEERLKKLEELKAKKVITDQEYQEQRRRILGEI